MDGFQAAGNAVEDNLPQNPWEEQDPSLYLREATEATPWINIPPQVHPPSPHPHTQSSRTSSVIITVQDTPTPSSSNLSLDTSHTYRRTSAVVDQETLDASFELCVTQGTTEFKCLWPGCGRKPLKRKYTARAHIHNHITSTKLFECVTWWETT